MAPTDLQVPDHDLIESYPDREESPTPGMDRVMAVNRVRYEVFAPLRAARERLYLLNYINLVVATQLQSGRQFGDYNYSALLEKTRDTNERYSASRERAVEINEFYPFNFPARHREECQRAQTVIIAALEKALAVLKARQNPTDTLTVPT
jgi:hypothetical protein